MKDSIISSKAECFFCKRSGDLHHHHIFFGTSNRKLSDEDGCWIYLCPSHHNMSSESVHQSRVMDLALKVLCQKEWEKIYGNREEFIKRYGKSYL